MPPIISFRYNSSLTVRELINNLGYVKIIYNHKVVYDDTTEEGEGPEGIERVDELYGDRIVYKMKIKVVDFHHCIIWIKGEK